MIAVLTLQCQVSYRIERKNGESFSAYRRLPSGGLLLPAQLGQVQLAELANAPTGGVYRRFFCREADADVVGRLPPERGTVQHGDLAPLVKRAHEFVTGKAGSAHV